MQVSNILNTCLLIYNELRGMKSNQTNALTNDVTV